MKRLIALVLAGSAAAFGSGTITPGARPGGANQCATSNIVGKISGTDVETGEISVTVKNGTRKFRVNEQTQFRIPGVKKSDLREAPLAKVETGAEAKLFYCTQDNTVVELKIQR